MFSLLGLQVGVAEGREVELVEARRDEARACARTHAPARRHLVTPTERARGLAAELRIAVMAQTGLPRVPGRASVERHRCRVDRAVAHRVWRARLRHALLDPLQQRERGADRRGERSFPRELLLLGLERSEIGECVRSGQDVSFIERASSTQRGVQFAVDATDGP